MGNVREAVVANGEAAAAEVHRLCVKVEDQIAKGQWWNAMAAANELVAACQQGCRAEIARVARARAPKEKSAKKKKKE